MQAQSPSVTEQLAELERLYHTAPVGLSFLDTQLRCVRVNEHLAAINGQPASAHLGRSLSELVPHMAATLEPILREVLRTGKPAVNVEVKSVEPGESTERSWLLDYHRLTDDDGRVLGITSVVQDVTAHRRAEEALQQGYRDLEACVKERTKDLRETNAALRIEVSERKEAQEAWQKSEEHLRLLLETTRAVPWTADGATFRFTYVGPQAVELLGYPVDQWYVEDFWPDHIHPDDRTDAIGFCYEASRTSDRYDFEYRMIAADGRIVWLQDFVSVVHENDGGTMLRGFMIDVSERKKAEQELKRSEARFRQVLDSAPDALLLVRRDGTLAYGNGVTSQLFGYSQEELDGLTIDRLIPQRFREQHSNHMMQYFESPRVRPMGIDGREFHGLRKDGSEFPAEISVSPLETDEGHLTACDVRDITDQRKAEEEARRLREQIAHVSRAETMGELAASLAHELNQPLSAIVNNARAGERLLERKGPYREALQSILADLASDGLRAGEVIRRLRALLKKGDRERQPLNLSDVVYEVLPLVQGDAQARKVSLQHDLAADLPPVSGDRIQLQQVVLNLIMNGLEAMNEVDDGRRTLSLSSSESGGYVQVTVSDSGVGLDAEQMDKIFQPFYTTKPQGMGMGLTINQSIVESHDGRLWATPNSSRGATFAFMIPADKRESP